MYDWRLPEAPVTHCRQPSCGRHAAAQLSCCTWMFHDRGEEELQVKLRVLQSSLPTTTIFP